MSIYLYVKRCQHCGLKYFGKTINEDVEKYTGSGTYWKRHINLHGHEHIVTDKIWNFDLQSVATEFALNFSKENNIVNSSDWANLIAEDGIDGNSSAIITNSLREKFRIANAGENNPQYGTMWINNGLHNKKINKFDQIPQGWTKGRYFSDEFRSKFVSRPKADKNNPRYNHTLYCFKHTVTGEQVLSTYREFYTTYKINPKGVRKLIRGQVVKFKEWIVVN